jgi:four helix bundle protein
VLGLGAVRALPERVAWVYDAIRISLRGNWLTELKKKVYELVDNSPACNDRRFCDQIKDSAASAPSNISEGFAYYRHGEFARHVRIAKASETETHNHLGDGVDRRYWSPGDAKPLQDLADRAIGAATRLLQYLMTTEAPSWRRRT